MTGTNKGLSFKFTVMLLPLVTAMAIFAITGCGNAKAAPPDQDASVSAFKYREVHLPEGLGDNADKLGLNTLEESWGIWGHNLAKVLPEEHSNSVYAKNNGATIKKQFCFSSNHLYEYIEDYIDRKFDDDERVRFAIVPNDNDIVCICEKCVAAGNTKNNASPAAEKLVRRLAARFPGHIFYTSDYRTTKGLPKDSMPVNSGVLVSAMNYPLSTVETGDELKFMSRLREWAKTTPRILVWDYINNFDDYFTPYPTFGIMQRRLKNYRDNKVTALFLNGSGPDASAFSRLRTEVLAELTANPDADWRALVKEKASSIYPVTGTLISDFILDQEDHVAQNRVTLPLYEGVEKARKTYLPEETFITFHDNLRRMRDEVDGDEMKELELLLGQLALTRLELKRINGNLRESESLLADLTLLDRSGVESYSESGWTIDNYVRDYRFLLKHAKETSGSNKLKGEKLISMTSLDPDYSDISILTDGVLGIPSNYHNGNMIMSPDRYTQIAVPNVPGMKKLRVWMMYNPVYRVDIPERITLKSGSREIKSIVPEYSNDHPGHSVVEFDIPGGVDGTLMLTVYKDPESHSMALEEIEGF